MAKFVQIGNQAFNPKWVSSIDISDTPKQVTLSFAVAHSSLNAPTLEFKDDEYDLFMQWWEEIADIYRVESG